MFTRHLRVWITLIAAALMLCAVPAYAQNGKLKIRVTPKQAYLFVDGKAINDGNHTIPLAAGKHTVAVVNYGYKISTQDINIDAGKTTTLDVKLEAYGGNVAGAWGRIQIKGPGRAAVLLEGKTPDYFVGQVDEFNWDWIWKQELLVPPGAHNITVTRNGTDVWSGSVNVAANQKVVIDLNKQGAQKTEAWPRGEQLMKKSPLPRFKAGIASATIVIAPVTIGGFTASATQINCGQSSTLNWSANDAVRANISNVGDVATTGSQSVTPHATTSYTLTETGPGGIATSAATVNVNTVAVASLSANPTELHYRKIGDRVKVQDSTTLTWTSSNVDNVTIDPLGKVELNGSQSIKAEPKKTDLGPVDETNNYSLNATNVCGGSTTQTASVHITGSIEPVPTVVLYSIFYPTDYPDAKHPSDGLLKSQSGHLTELAAGFKKYLEYDEGAKLSITAYADQRGSKPHNQELSERRVERIKQFLVDQGVASDKVETAAYGEDRNLTKDEVKGLEEANPAKATKKHVNKNTTWLAYNRRADVVLLPSGQKSAQYYPNDASDVDILWQLAKPNIKKVEMNQ